MTEEILNKSASQKVEVLNQGTTGVGLAYLYNLMLNIGLDYDPDVVLLAFYIGNSFFQSDLRKKVIARYGYFRSVRVDPEHDFFVRDRDLYFFTFLEASYRYLQNGLLLWDEARRGEKTGILAKPIYLKREKGKLRMTKLIFYQSAKWYRTQNMLKMYRDTLKEQGREFYVILLPDEFQLNEQLRNDLFSVYPDLKETEMDYLLPQKQLKEFFNEQNISYLDLFAAFERESKTRKLFKHHEPHYNVEGNELVAKEVAAFIQEQVLNS